MISGNYTGYNNQMSNIPYGAVKDVVPQNINQKLPENLQNLDAEQIANQNDALAMTQNASPKTLAVAAPIYLGFVGLRSANDHIKSPFRFSGDYEKSFLGKLAKLGDNIYNKMLKIIPDKVEKGIPKKIKSAKNWMVEHSAIARSFTTPIKLESPTALQEANGLFGRVLFDDITMLEKGYKGDLKRLLKGDGTSSFWNLLKSKGIEGLKDQDDVLKTVKEVLQDLAQSPVKDKKTQQYAIDLIETLSKSNEKVVIDKWGKLPIGKIPVIGKFFTLEVPMSEIANKLRVSAGISGDKLKTGAGVAAVGTTALGKALPSGFAKVYEGITSNFVGGKIAPFLQAFFLASAAMRAKDAPEGQKLATFMDEEAAGVATLFTMPMATSILTKMGGLKYLGMGADGASQQKAVQTFRDMVKALNEKIDAGTLTRGEYLDEAKKIKNFLNCKPAAGGKSTLRFWQKPLKAIGKVLGANYKNETIKPFIEDAIPTDMGKLKSLGVGVSNKVQSLMYKFKTGGFMGLTPAGIMRFGLVFLVLTPILSKPIKWVVNKIFGKPYDAAKEKEEKEKKAQEEAMKNNPFLKMTDEELVTLLSKNQDTMAQIQNNPQLMQELQTNPQKLYDILQEGARKKDEALQKMPPSPMLQGYMARNGMQPQMNPYTQGYAQPQMQQPYNMQQNPYNNGQIMPSQGYNMYQNSNMQNGAFNQNQGMNFNTNAQMPSPSIQPQNNGAMQPQKPQEPARSYIPSSAPSPYLVQAQNAEDARFNSIMADMDKTEQEFTKYLNI